MHVRTIIVAALFAGGTAFAAGAASIVTVEPTPLFPKPVAGQPLKQLARLHIDNPGAPVAAVARVTVGTQAPETQELGTLAKGKSVVDIKVPDIAAPTPVTVELIAKGGQVLAVKKLDWQPQRKWRLYSCAYSHQDLGYGDYPHRLRTSIRHKNIELPLRYCGETDSWPDDSKYRFNIETSEPLTSFISFYGKDAARDLSRRIREGRINLGALHNTANTEELSRELMARLFYMSGRHAVDLLGIPQPKVAQNDDVIGLTWPLATYAAEADAPYFFHGFNGTGHCMLPAENEPVFRWRAPDARGELLMRSMPYGGYGQYPVNLNVKDVLYYLSRHGRQWPYDAALLPEGDDFTLATRGHANQILAWNARWAYPRLICGTMRMFFDDVAAQAGKVTPPAYEGDANNLWSDQDYAAARASGQARKLGQALPATETLASVAQALTGGSDQWINLFQGYHRLLQYWEHTNAKDSPIGRYENPPSEGGNKVWYETELEENREMAAEAAGYQQQAFTSASQRLTGLIARVGKKNLIVFNPLPYPRTEIVRAAIPAGSVVDDTGRKAPVQQLPDGTAVFVATDIPATGYRTYSLVGDLRPATTVAGDLDSKFYRLQFNPVTGALTSLFDKTLGAELVERNAPHAFNEYLYEFRTSKPRPNDPNFYDSAWSRMEKAESVAVSRGPVADVLTVTGKADGVRELRQTLILYRDLSRMDFGIWMDKAPLKGLFDTNKEAVFVALPFNIPNFTIRHALPGAVIEPYRQQFEGSATGHHAIQDFTDISNDKYGVTVSPVEGSLVCYGAPTSSPLALWLHREELFPRDRAYPKTSRLYLYLLNNMFDVNIAADQQGPVNFQWSLRSHAGDWKTGGADQFGRAVQQPLIAWRADGKNTGALPASASFMTVSAPNVTCSVIKPAEVNGRGFIIRLNETAGKETTATVALPLLSVIESVKETSLVENDRAEIGKGNTFQVTLPKFGVKTYRVTCAGKPLRVDGLEAKAVADMQVELRWTSKDASHFNIYRDTQPECAPTQLNFIGQSATGTFTDRPRPHIGGWLRSCLAPKTAYYYRVVPVDRANNPGAPSPAATVTTPSAEQANLPPVAVEGLRAILVSPICKDNYVSLLFRTACEPDVMQYEIFRGDTLVGVVKSDEIPPRSGGYGEARCQGGKYKVREYDHTIFTDKTTEPGTTYSYKVRAVDAAGQKGAFSEAVTMRTKGMALAGLSVTAQSTYAPVYGAALALDGDPDPFSAWISQPYGGGTKASPRDTWWAVEFLKTPATLKGVKIIGDYRGNIPLLKNLQVQVCAAGVWKTVGEVKNATTKDVTVTFAAPVATTALRIFVPAADIPSDGYVRICEITAILPDDSEAAFAKLVP